FLVMLSLTNPVLYVGEDWIYPLQETNKIIMHQKFYTYILFTFFIALLAACGASKDKAAREKLDFTENWSFHLGDLEGAHLSNFVDTAWRQLDVPHDWSIEGTFDKNNPAGVGGGALPGGVGWYRKSFSLE